MSERTDASIHSDMMFMILSMIWRENVEDKQLKEFAGECYEKFRDRAVDELVQQPMSKGD